MTPGGGPRVLLVDDTDSVRLTFGALLEDSGYRLDQADSVAAGRSLLMEQVYDLAIFDLNLRDGAGTELIEDARRRNPNVVIALLTGAECAPIEGVALVMQKSEAPHEILQRLAHSLASAQERR